MSDLHVHFHGEVAAGATLVIQVPPTGGIAAAINQLKEQLTMDAQQAIAKIGEVKDAVGTATAQVQKGIDEVLLKMSQAQNVDPELEAAINGLNDAVAPLRQVAQALDDIVPDATA
jgi:hypothetical protein